MRPRWNDFWEVVQETAEITIRPEPKKRFEALWETRKSELRRFLGHSISREFPSLPNIPMEYEIREQKRNWILDTFSNRNSVFFGRSEMRQIINLFLDSTLLDLPIGHLSEESMRNLRIDRLDNGLKAGLRITKALFRVAKAHIRPELTETELDILGQSFSRLLSKVKSQKTMTVISIDPLDFLLASEHTSGWTSCHSLGGEQVNGNMNYLLDSHTVITYTYDTISRFYTGKDLPRKIRRRWIYIDYKGGVAYFQKVFPSESIPETERLKEIVTKLFSDYLGKRTLKSEMTYGPGDFTDFHTEDHVLFHTNYLGSRDKIAAKLRIEGARPERITVGESIFCIDCEKLVLSSSPLLLCLSCYCDYPICTLCNIPIDSEDYSIKGPCLCQQCETMRDNAGQ